jgi:hypothetical protein
MPEESRVTEDGLLLFTADELLASNIRRMRRRRFLDGRYTLYGRGDLDTTDLPAIEDVQQEHVAARMRHLGHNWVQQTVSEVERGRRRVSVTELLSLTLVLGANLGDLLDPIGRTLAVDARARVQVSDKDLPALLCGHTRRATVEWGGEQLTELAGVEFKDVDQ